MKVQDVMTKDVAACQEHDTLNRAAQLMWERRCGTVAVVDGEGKLLGLLTDRDLCMATYTQGRSLGEIAATTAMSRPAQTCAPQASIEEAEDLMMAEGCRRLPVVEDERLKGILSLDDIARYGAVWDATGEIDMERVGMTLGEIAHQIGPAEQGAPAKDAVPSGGDLAELAEGKVAALRTLRDEIRVEINLASKELRDRWRRLEARLSAAEVRLRRPKWDGVRSLGALAEGLKDVKAKLRATRKAPRAERQPRSS